MKTIGFIRSGKIIHHSKNDEIKHPHNECTQNICFNHTTTKKDIEFENNIHLEGFKMFYLDDIQQGTVAKYYFYHVAQDKWMAIDTDEEFNVEIKRLEDAAIKNKANYLTEKFVFENIIINGIKIPKISLLTFVVEGGNLFDPTIFQMGIGYGCSQLSYIQIN